MFPYKVHDITMPIFPGMTVYKNKPEKQPVFELTRTHEEGGVQESSVTLDVHTGTHVDAPLHMIESGATIDSIGLEQLVRPCQVIDLTHVEDGIARSDLEDLDLSTNAFLLFKTQNSFADEFDPEFIYIKADAAQYLAEHGIQGVGIDALGVERAQPEHETHRYLFEAGVVIIEGLALKDIAPGSYQLIAAPIPLVGVDAAPARVLLLEHV